MTIFVFIERTWSVRCWKTNEMMNISVKWNRTKFETKKAKKFKNLEHWTSRIIEMIVKRKIQFFIFFWFISRQTKTSKPSRHFWYKTDDNYNLSIAIFHITSLETFIHLKQTTQYSSRVIQTILKWQWTIFGVVFITWNFDPSSDLNCASDKDIYSVVTALTKSCEIFERAHGLAVLMESLPTRNFGSFAEAKLGFLTQWEFF